MDKWGDPQIFTDLGKTEMNPLLLHDQYHIDSASHVIASSVTVTLLKDNAERTTELKGRQFCEGLPRKHDMVGVVCSFFETSHSLNLLDQG